MGMLPVFRRRRSCTAIGWRAGGAGRRRSVGTRAGCFWIRTRPMLSGGVGLGCGMRLRSLSRSRARCPTGRLILLRGSLTGGPGTQGRVSRRRTWSSWSSRCGASRRRRRVVCRKTPGAPSRGSQRRQTTWWSSGSTRSSCCRSLSTTSSSSRGRRTRGTIW